MSAWHERQYRLRREREIRAQAHQRRMKDIQRNNENFILRYEQVLNDLVNQGLEEFMQDEFNFIRQEINRIRFASDPFEARQWSMELAQRVRTLPAQAREQRRVYQEYERLQKEEQEREARQQLQKIKEEKQLLWTSLTDNWENKLARNLAFKKLAELKKQLFKEDLDIEDVKIRVETIKKQSEIEAQKIQQEFTENINAQAVKEQKEEFIQEIEKIKLPVTQSERLKQKITEADEKNIGKVIKEIQQSEDVSIENEEIRREMVKAVYKSLKEAGFSVSKPIKQNDDEDIVLIQAHRPSGNQAKFRVKLDGTVRYEFDNYKGQQCKKDMEQVLPKLSEIYGVNLSKERVIWENPDDEKMDAKPIAPIYNKSQK